LNAIDVLCISLRRTKLSGCADGRLYAGSNHLYVFINPQKAEAPSDLPDDITWEYAQREIAQAKGFVAAGASSLSAGEQCRQARSITVSLVYSLSAVACLFTVVSFSAHVANKRVISELIYLRVHRYSVLEQLIFSCFKNQILLGFQTDYHDTIPLCLHDRCELCNV